MSETKWKYHPSNPANQPFNINGRKNLTKTRAWFQVGKTNGVKRSKKAATTEE